MTALTQILDEHEQPPVNNNDVMDKVHDEVESAQNSKKLDIPSTAEPRRSKRLKEKTRKVRFENR